MDDYKVVKFSGNIGMLANQEEYRIWWKRFMDAHQYNEQLYRDRMSQHSELLKLAKTVYGGETNEVRYIRSHPPQKGRVNLKREWDRLMQKLDAWNEAEARRVKGREAYQRKKARLLEWTRLLEENGFVQPHDFRWSYADKAAANLLVEVEPGVYRRKTVNTPMIEEGR